MVLGVFALADIIFLGASHAAAVPAAIPKFRPPLRERHYANASLLGLVRMLADLAALLNAMRYVFISNQSLLLALALLDLPSRTRRRGARLRGMRAVLLLVLLVGVGRGGRGALRWIVLLLLLDLTHYIKYYK
jgi:hypothetical protein